ncbi:hypothetical protein CRUP_020699 [Coryphaenoides rupestris]|nr:hypothetical protein CRUP_020699 [Coryphaenoides rupestris]
MVAMSALRSAAAVFAARLSPLRSGHHVSRLLTRASPRAEQVAVRWGHGKKLFVVQPSTFYDTRFLKLLVKQSWLTSQRAMNQSTGSTIRRAFKEASHQMKIRGDGPWYQVNTVDKGLIDHAPKSSPDY